MSLFTRICLTSDPGVYRTIIRFKTSKPIPDFGKTTYVYRNLPDREKNPEFEENEYYPRRLSYWPAELPQYRIKPKRFSFYHVKEYITLYPPKVEEIPEWTSEANYPPISDIDCDSWDDHFRMNRLKWYDKIKNLPSVEEKMLELAHNRRLYSLDMKCCNLAYNNLPITQNLTRTNLVQGIPSWIDKVDSDTCSKYMEELKSHICDAINLHFSSEHEKTLGRYRRTDVTKKALRTEIVKMENITYDLATLVMNYLTSKNPDLLNTQVDLYPSIKSSWFVGGMELPARNPRYTSWRLKKVNQPVVYNGNAVVNMRNDTPIRPLVDVNDEICQTTTYQESSYHPIRNRYPFRLRRLSATAGFWPQSGDKDFPFLTFMSLHPLFLREEQNGRQFDDTEEEVESMGILNAFSWCNSMAVYHGFSPFHEVTYPFTTQTILTDGQFWTFQIYQMNTHTFHSDLNQFGKTSPTRNICWTSGRMKLFEEVDENGQVHESDLNEDVLRTLIQFICRETDRSWMDQCDLRPYLGEDLRTEEEKSEMRLALRRWFAQGRTAQEVGLSKLHMPLNWEYVFGDRNKHAPDGVWLRKPEKFRERSKLDRNYFEHM